MHVTAFRVLITAPPRTRSMLQLYVADRASARCALSTTRDASHAAFFANSMSSSWRHWRASRRGIVAFASSNAPLARATSEVKSEWVSAWVPRFWELWGWRSAERGEPGWRRWGSVERGRSAGGFPRGFQPKKPLIKLMKLM